MEELFEILTNFSIYHMLTFQNQANHLDLHIDHTSVLKNGQASETPFKPAASGHKTSPKQSPASRPSPPGRQMSAPTTGSASETDEGIESSAISFLKPVGQDYNTSSSSHGDDAGCIEDKCEGSEGTCVGSEFGTKASDESYDDLRTDKGCAIWPGTREKQVNGSSIWTNLGLQTSDAHMFLYLFLMH
ncbi:unnamed protein product [Protopolystoma xenopodis]|uniref:Uncharacterized protein n=1 Tax=Protopolystoma xenopodis TaxID=117903 RepID=A0A3S5B2Y2_9PLAT|nr:unnamed protein product [Protopolystoma xenopodis]